MPNIVGYFDTASATMAAVDPGLDVRCIVCWEPLRRHPRVTISLMWEHGDRSYFFRAHKPCWDALDPSQQQRYEESVLTGKVAP